MTTATGNKSSERRHAKLNREQLRREIEAEVNRRATLDSRGDVAVLVALANAEKQFRRDYSGRFLIELIQNARDAWVKANSGANDAALVVAITDQPALMVGNAGEPISADVLLYSIGLVGESTKDPTQSIGHKGVGIKSILGVTDRPEIYSREDPDGPFDIQVGFDREWALAQVHRLSGSDGRGKAGWMGWLQGLPGAASAQGDERVPILAFPSWIDDHNLDGQVEVLQALAETPLNTIVRLPYVGPDSGRQAWLVAIEEAIDGLSDEMILLLGSFATVRILRSDGRVEIQRVESDARPIEMSNEAQLRGATVREVTVTRRWAEGQVSASSWLLYEAQLESVFARDGVDAGLAIAVRVERRDGRLAPVPASDDPSGTKFHLFFPTEIATHLPFLFHAYFEVEGSRKRFAVDSDPHNQARLDGLRALTRLVFKDLVAESEAERFDLTPLPALMAVASRPPEDALARDGFHAGVLDDLREAAWVAATGLDGHPSIVMPSELLVGGGNVADHLLWTAVPQPHIARYGRRYPHPAVPLEGVQFLAELEPSSVLDTTTALQLLSPIGDHDPDLWPLADVDAVDTGFGALLEVLIALAERTDRKAFAAEVSKVRGRFIPVIDKGAFVRRLVGPQPVEGGSGRQALFARTGEEAANQISVPPVLQMAFLPDRVIGPDRVSHAVVVDLGIRPFDTNSIVMRLATVLENLESAAWTDEAAGAILRFMGALLSGDRQSSYRLSEIDEARDEFTPTAYFWTSEKERDDRRRRFGLSMVRVPTKHHGWQPAASCVLGAEWGERLKAVDHKQSRDRARALAELDKATPAEAFVVAGPDEVMDILGLEARRLEHFDEAGLASPEELALRAAHALLLRLGAWEILPLVGAHDFSPGAAFDPFTGHAHREGWREWVERTEATSFDRDGRPATRRHPAWSVGEDYRLLWEMPPSRPGFVEALGVAARFLDPYLHSRLLCQGCAGWHSSSWRSSEVDSLLRYQLLHTPWISVTADGARSSVISPTAAWWEPYVPAGPGFKTSPLRYLALAEGIDERVADLLGLPSLASDRGQRPRGARLDRELQRLKDEYVDGILSPDPRSSPAARQAFVALHRRLYGLLAPIMSDEQHTFIGRTGVLTERDGSLVWVPPEDARFDDRNFSSYRGAFEDAVAFSILPSDERSTATALGIIHPFEVDEERNTPDQEVDVTDVVRPVLMNALPRLFALLVHDPIGGGTPLRLEGDELAERAKRVASMLVFQVSSLSIQATEKRSRISRQVGATEEEDAYLDRSTPGLPRLYHEFQGDDWLDRLRPALGAHVARLLDSGSHEDAFARLLAGSDMAQDRLLQNRGITHERIRAVRERLRDLDLLDEESDRNWWSALLEVLRARPWTSGDRSDLSECLSEALTSMVAEPTTVAEVTAEILRAGAGPGVRDASSDGREVLSLLARVGVSLKALHLALRLRGDGGLQVDVAERLLAAWRKRHDADLLVALTRRSSISAVQALARVEELTTDPAARFDPEPPLDAWLGDVVNLLRSIEIDITVTELSEPDFETRLRALLDLEEGDYDERRRAAFDSNLRTSLESRNAGAWRTALIPVVVAMTIDQSALDADLREAAQRLRGSAPTASHPSELAPWFAGEVAAICASLASSVQRRLEEAGWEHAPDMPFIDDLMWTSGRAALLDRVRVAIARTPPPRVIELRSAIKRLRAAQVGAPLVPVEVRPGPGRTNGSGEPKPEPGDEDKKDVTPGPPPDGRGKERSGRAAELLVLASMVEHLSSLPEKERRARIEALKLLLQKWFKGLAVAKLLAAGDEARLASPGDELDDALVRFLHAADCSPAFGFDVLGFAFKDGQATPALLEVKAVGRATGNRPRDIHVPLHEWKQAKRIGAEYAFLLVSHDAKGGPAALEVIRDPAGQLTPRGTLTRSVDQYLVAIPRPDQAPSFAAEIARESPQGRGDLHSPL